MSKTIIICAVLVFFAFSINVALSDMQYPPELNQVCVPYPEATITQTVQVPGNVMVGMQSGDTPEKIHEFYKKQLAANGWTIQAETREQGHSGLICEKGSNNAVVNISAGQSGKSLILIMLAPQQ